MNYFEKLYVHKYENIIINAPVQIMESAIIKDTVDNIIYLRNIFTNVSSNTIIAIILEGKLYDITGELISENNGEFSYTYQDIKVVSNDLFGNKIPIILPNNVRRIDVSINKVVTESGEVISYSGRESIIPLSPEYINLPENYLDTLDSFKQPPIIYPIIKDEYWQCTCGRINWKHNNTCGLCKRSISDQEPYKSNNIQINYDNYIEQKNKEIKEKEEQERKDRDQKKEEERKRIEQANIEQQRKVIESQKKQRKIAITCAISAVSLGVILLSIFYIIPTTKQSSSIKKAEKLIEEAKYAEAISIYSEIDKEKYKSEIEHCQNLYIDSLLKDNQFDLAKEYLISIGYNSTSDEVMNCDYLKAEKLTVDGDFDAAEAIYNTIKEFKDSNDKINNLDMLRRYDEAVTFINQGKYYDALNIFEDLGDFKDSSKYISDNIENAINELYSNELYPECISLCDKYELKNDYYYSSNYKYGIELYNNDKSSQAIYYLENCKSHYPEVEEYIKNANQEVTYETAINNANNGYINSAIELFSEIKDYKDSSQWISKCEEASDYFVKYDLYKYEIIMTSGNKLEYSADEGAGDIKVLNVSAKVDENMEIHIFANYHEISIEKMFVTYDKSSKITSLIDLNNKTITDTYWNGEQHISYYK